LTGESYVAGTTRSPDFPLRYAIQDICAGCPASADAYFARIPFETGDLECSTLLGGSGAEGDRVGTIHRFVGHVVYGSTSSADFSLALPLQGTFGGGPNDGFGCGGEGVP